MFEGDEAIAAMQYWERVIAHAHAQQMKAMVQLAELRRRENDGYEAFVGDEIALALNISRAAADHRLALAWELAERLPETLAALERGDVDLTRARAIADAVGPLTSEQAARVEERVLDRARDQNAPELRRVLKRAVLVVDPDGAAGRHRRRRAERRIVVTPDDDGMSHLYAYLPATTANAIYLAVDRAAKCAKTPDDGRTADQRRADAFLDLLLGARTAPLAQIRVVVPASTLLGTGAEPGELAGYGPIAAELAREAAADATWTRLLTDPASGTLLDFGRTTYRPPATLADFVRTRDGTCRFPGCMRSAERCELDHRTRYPDGPTSASNLDALCTHHHQLKHRGGWAGTRLPDGTYHWTSPAGHVYLRHADPVIGVDPPPSGREVPAPAG